MQWNKSGTNTLIKDTPTAGKLPLMAATKAKAKDLIWHLVFLFQVVMIIHKATSGRTWFFHSLIRPSRKNATTGCRQGEVESKVGVTNDLAPHGLGPGAAFLMPPSTPDSTGIASWNEAQFFYCANSRGVNGGIGRKRAASTTYAMAELRLMTDDELKAILLIHKIYKAN